MIAESSQQAGLSGAIQDIPYFGQPSSDQMIPPQEAVPSRRSERILIVDDDLWTAEVLSRQLDLVGFDADITDDSTQVMGMLQSQHYDLLISDICMPPPDGLALLEQIQPRYPFLAVLMLTGVNDVETATLAMRNGASDYILKPHNNGQLIVRVERALERSRLLREQANRHQLLKTRVEEQTHQLREQSRSLRRMLSSLLVTYQATLKALEAALDVRDQSAPGHCRRVARLTVQLAKWMGFQDGTLIDIEHGALLHDIGKLSIPDAILLKPGPLTDQERKVVEKHPEVGCKIVGNIAFLRNALPIIRYHHERYDGEGYPYGLRGDEIPITARIFSVVDAFDALTNQRPYNQVVDIESALQELERGSGTFFDPDVVDRFTAMMRQSGGRPEPDTD